MTKEPCIYAAELSGGVIKIGYSRAARYRMQSLAQDVKREMDADLLRWHVMPKQTARAAYLAETKLIAILAAVAQVLPGKREFFSGLSFEVAVAVMSAVAKPA